MTPDKRSAQTFRKHSPAFKLQVEALAVRAGGEYSVSVPFRIGAVHPFLYGKCVMLIVVPILPLNPRLQSLG